MGYVRLSKNLSSHLILTFYPGFYTCLFIATLTNVYSKGGGMSRLIALIIGLYIANSSVSSE